MGRKYEMAIFDRMFFLLIITTAFCDIPKYLQMFFWGGNTLGGKLAFYPTVICILYSLYFIYNKKWNWPHRELFSRFLLMYISVNLVSLILGLIQYPFWDVVLNGPTNQIEKLPTVLALFHDWGIHIDEAVLMSIWITCRSLKNLLLETVYTFGGAYLLYCWFRCRKEIAIQIMTKGICIALIPVIVYGLIDLAYLAHFGWAEDILKTVNPFLHVIKDNGTWYPPLLWEGQLRSVFSEPSHFGIWCAFAMPWLWYQSFLAGKIANTIIYSAIIFLLSFLIFMTQARTAVVLLVGEVIVFALCMIWVRKVQWIFRLGMLIGILAIAFVGANLFITNIMSMKSVVSTVQPFQTVKISKAVESYVKSNVVSLASTTQRSNGARYSMMVADLKIGLEHPLFGVGGGLRNAYIPSHFPELAKNNKEVNIWIQKQKEQGIFKSTMPRLGEYTSRFAETGILGLGVFLFPSLFLILKMGREILKRSYKVEDRLTDICFFTSFTGIMATGIGDILGITYCYWILLGIGYALCFDDKRDESTV